MQSVLKKRTCGMWSHQQKIHQGSLANIRISLTNSKTTTMPTATESDVKMGERVTIGAKNPSSKTISLTRH